MNTFLSVISKKGKINQKTVSNEVQKLAKCSLASFPGECKRCEWYSNSKRIAFFGWSNENLKNTHTMDNIGFNRNGITCIIGYATSRLEDIDENLFEYCKNDYDRKKYVGNLGGIYSICCVDERTESITVWNTITRVQTVYFCENQDYYIISSRALLAHLFCEKSCNPQYEIHNLIQFINNGYYSSDFTPYKDISIMPQNSQLKITDSGLEITSIDDAVDNGNKYIPTSEFYDELAQSLIDSVKGLKDKAIHINLGLTGGRDSRLLAATLKCAGIDFETYTFGFLDHPDVIIAKQIASILNINHRVDVPKITTDKEIDKDEYITAEVFNRTKNVLFVTDGMLSGYQNIARYKKFSDDENKVTGHGGELIRGGYLSNVSSMDEFFAKHDGAFSEFMTDEAVHESKKFFENFLKNECAGLNNNEIVRKIFLKYDIGRWSAAGMSGYSAGFHLYTPLNDNVFVKKLQSIPIEYCTNEEVLYNLLIRLNSALVEVPFMNIGWKCKDKIAKIVPPIKLESKSKASFNWRKTVFTDMKDVFYQAIFGSDVYNKLACILDMNKIKALFENPGDYCDNMSINMRMWHVYTAAVLLSNKWLDPATEDIKVKVKIR